MECVYVLFISNVLMCYFSTNFLAIDIYFAQLKYQDIQQIEAYDGEAFFSKF